MDYTPIFQIVIAGLVMLATQGVKKVQSVPINEGQTVRVRSFVAVATFGLTAVTAYLDGNLESVLSPEIIEVGLWTGASWVAAHLGYKLLIKK